MVRLKRKFNMNRLLFQSKNKIVLLFLFALINCHCHKQNSPVIDVSSVSATDVVGNLVGSIDKTDWTKDSNWTPSENNLFEQPGADQLTNTQTSTVSVGPAFPNPFGSTFMFNFQSSGVTLLQLVITDKFLSVKERHYYLSKTGTNFLQLKLDETKYANNNNYRVYYSFYSLADGVYFKGHGDIKISR
ncbi:MAG: hypothetical protein ABI285_02655 [Ginsengibacter sp.]